MHRWLNPGLPRHDGGTVTIEYALLAGLVVLGLLGGLASWAGV